MSRTLIDVFDWWASERKDMPALVCGEDSISYSELRGWSTSVAEWLIESGLELGDRVTVLAGNSLEWAVLAQGVMRAGGMLAPINPRFTVSEIDYMVKRYESRFIFYDEEREEHARAVAELNAFSAAIDVCIVRELRGEAGSSLSQTRRAMINDDTEVVIIPTSGSTARPKGVVYSNRTILDYSMQYALAETHASDRPGVVIFAPLCTSAGYVVMTQHMVYGGTAFIAKAFDPRYVLSKINEGKVTTIMGVPYFFEQMAALAEFESTDMSNVRIATVGGSRCPESLLKVWLEKGVLIKQLYGQTECGGQGTINTDEAALTHPEKCGRGNIFTRIAVVDDTGDFCGPGVPGEIVIKGPGNMVRYWNDPEETTRVLKDGWLHTGDRGVLDEDGLLTFIDRIKDIIISGGMNVSAAEVERVIGEFQGVREVAVIAASDEKFGETPLAVVYGDGNLDQQALFAHCRRELSSYKVPKYIAIEADPLPRLATQKIAKPVLRDRYKNAHLELPPLK